MWHFYLVLITKNNKMKISFLILCLFNLIAHGFAKTDNCIDSIKTDVDVELFLNKNVEQYSNFRIAENYSDLASQLIFDSLKIDLWHKVDFDKNGYIDLLVVNKSFRNIVLVLSYGNNVYRPFELNYYSDGLLFRTYYAKIDKINNLPIIKLYHFDFCRLPNNKIDFSTLKSRIRLDTLTLFNGFFCELPKKSRPVSKISIEYGSWGWETKITLKKRRKIKYISFFKQSILGTSLTRKSHIRRYSNKIEPTKFDSLWAVIKYIDWDNYKNEYKSNCIEDATGANVTIYYNNTVKKISDYPLCGTQGLMYIYRWFDDWYEMTLKKR